jgi:hypothetical protein
VLSAFGLLGKFQLWAANNKVFLEGSFSTAGSLPKEWHETQESEIVFLLNTAPTHPTSEVEWLS